MYLFYIIAVCFTTTCFILLWCIKCVICIVKVMWLHVYSNYYVSKFNWYMYITTCIIVCKHIECTQGGIALQKIYVLLLNSVDGLQQSSSCCQMSSVTCDQNSVRLFFMKGLDRASLLPLWKLSLTTQTTEFLWVGPILDL